MVLGATPPPAEYLVFAEDFPNAAFRSSLLPQLDELIRRHAYTPACRFGRVVALRRV
jgi:hypothetical protein